MCVKTNSFVVFFVFLFLVSANYGLAENCESILDDGDLKLLKGCSFDKKNKIITGVVENTGDNTYDDVFITFELYDNDNNMFDTFPGHTGFLRPKGTWHFKLGGVNDMANRVVAVQLSGIVLKKQEIQIKEE